jgi:hypothetical protein
MPSKDFRPHTQEAALLLEVLAELQAIRGLLEAGQCVPGPLPRFEAVTAELPAKRARTKRAPRVAPAKVAE